ncbi:hypothetical protein Taro_024868 [Colocasia esculenta]|uniref:Uncharacterized protein n=1 Tax=Colocasia esculenta TaxID=4460 RepID=A0A843VLN1_COLES|nr:hypothetical protein [Colocasia esculenta]
MQDSAAEASLLGFVQRLCFMFGWLDGSFLARCLVWEGKFCFSFLWFCREGRRLSVGMAAVGRGYEPNGVNHKVGFTVHHLTKTQAPGVFCTVGGLPSELLWVPELVEVFSPRGILHLHHLLLLAQFLDAPGHVVHFLGELDGDLSYLTPTEVIFEGPIWERVPLAEDD